MPNTLFICYAHGCRGEYLSHKISRHDFFQTLDVRKVSGRTIIDSDHYDKKFLEHSFPDVSDYSIPETNIVVPSHYFYDTLSKHFPQANFVTIDAPREITNFHEDLFERFFSYRPENLQELTGESSEKYLKYNPDATPQEVKKFIVKVLKMKNATIGDIACLANGIPNTDDNKRMLVEIYNPQKDVPKTQEIKDNTLVVPYESVHDINVQEVVDYVKRSKGSL
jgi:hypothetical protein|tara:strand:+ start:509 stop:1177 length:669 start_codon:yes stop_codon:yes gene_type:complete